MIIQKNYVNGFKIDIATIITIGMKKMSPDNANIMVDTGSCFHVACQTWKVKKVNSFLLLEACFLWDIGVLELVPVSNDRKDTIVIT